MRTRDVWTLKPGISFGRSGGEEFHRVRVRGIEPAGSRHGIRTGLYAGCRSRNQRASRMRTRISAAAGIGCDVAFEDNSDGRLRDFVSRSSVLSLNSPVVGRRRGAGLGSDRLALQPGRGRRQVSPLRRKSVACLVAGLASVSNAGYVARASVLRGRTGSVSSHRRSAAATVLPEDRKLAYPFVEVTFLQDAFEERRNQDQIERTEDLYTGTFWRGRDWLCL